MSLRDYGLRTILQCAAELVEAVQDYDLVLQSSASSDHAEDQTRDPDKELEAIEEASNRLKRALGANGPLGMRERLSQNSTPSWPEFDQQFQYAQHSKKTRQALWKLANAGIDLSGFARLQEPSRDVLSPMLSMREQQEQIEWEALTVEEADWWCWLTKRDQGARLLQQGLWQLWSGLSGEAKTWARPILDQVRGFFGWPESTNHEPPAYSGPDGLAEIDTFRRVDMVHGYYAVVERPSARKIATELAQYYAEVQQLCEERRLDEANQEAVFGRETCSIAHEEEPQVNVFRKEGDLWRIVFDGKEVLLKDSRGLLYISELIRVSKSGKQISAWELHCLQKPQLERTPESEDVAIDQEAREKLRERIQSLRDDIQEAKDLGNYRKQEELQREFEQIGDQVTKDEGWRGKQRELNSKLEKARSPITKAIKNALQKIKLQNQKLWTHLYSSVQTGNHCWYAPDSKIEWQL